MRSVTQCRELAMWQGGQRPRQAWRPLALQLSLHCLWGQGLGAGAGVTIRRTQPRTEEEAVRDASAVQLALWTSHFSVPKPRRVVPGQVGRGGRPWARQAFPACWVISALACPTDQGTLPVPGSTEPITAVLFSSWFSVWGCHAFFL